MKHLLIPLIVLSILLLPACGSGTPTATPVPATATPAITDPCLVGIWEPVDYDAFWRMALPPGSFDVATLEFVHNSGRAAYNFGSDGQLDFLAAQAESRYRSGEERMLLELKMDGYASAGYQLEGDRIVVGKLLSSIINYQALLDSQPMMDVPRAAEFVPLFVPPYTTARFVCSGDSLSLELVDLPGGTGPLQFKRTK